MLHAPCWHHKFGAASMRALLVLLLLLPRSDATRLLLVRHGRTFMNEHLSQPGKAWGDPGFVDPGLWDTRLTPTGEAHHSTALPMSFATPEPCS